jgi:hypothetical protein
MEHFVIAAGGLHIEIAALQILGDWLEDSGWTSSMAEANIASSGVVKYFMKATNDKRNRLAHQVTSAES